MKKLFSFCLIAALTLSLSACKTLEVADPSAKKLTFQLPYDLTYLRVLEAVDGYKDWQLALTEKEQGTLKLRDVNYSNLVDADLREITILIERIDPTTTAVYLSPSSQKGGKDVLNKIKETLAKVVKR